MHYFTPEQVPVLSTLARSFGVCDRWHASAITTPGDLAAFTCDDLDEARSRLRRLALIWEVRLRSLSDQQLDERAGDAWTLRQLAFHLAESAFYAESVGMLAP